MRRGISVDERSFCGIRRVTRSPSQDFEQNRLLYALFLYMSQKLIAYAYLTNESVYLRSQILALLTITLNDFYHSTSQLQSGDRISG